MATATTRCARCGGDNDPAFAFCHACGQPLRPPAERRCEGCGARLEPSFRFCGYCGRPAPAEAPAPPPPAPPRAVSGIATPGPGELASALARHAAAARPEGLRLVAVRHDGQPGAVAPLGGEPVVCGRARGDLVFPDDATVSPEHARFTRRDGGAVVEDLGSVNGTFLRLTGPRAVGPGDELRLGRQLLRVDPVPRPSGGGAARPWGSPDPGYRTRLVQLLDGGGVGEVFPLRAGENSVGREVGDVAFPGDRYVSARHARLEVSDAGITVADVGSSNGTYVRIGGPTPVAAGDQLLVGMQLIRVE
jgi:pSer/pThr/pTyr-binding forkhead associated (FHA) protein